MPAEDIDLAACRYPWQSGIFQTVPALNSSLSLGKR